MTFAEHGRVATVAALAREGGPQVEALLAFLADPSWPVRRQAVAGLASIGAGALAPLCRLLAGVRDDEGRIAATVDALVALRGDPSGELEALVGHPDAAVVADVAQILGRRRDRTAVPLLARLVAHVDDNVAVAAIEALGRIGGAGGIDALVAASASDNFFRAFAAIDVLGRSGDLRALAPLVALLDVPTYQLEAARALGQTGEAAAIPGLARLLAIAVDGTVRSAAVAIHELFRVHGARFGLVDLVEAALHKAHPGAEALRRLAGSVPGAARAEQEAVAHVLGILGGEAAPAALRHMLDGDGPIAEAAAAALRRQGGESEEVRVALRTGDAGRRRLLLAVVSRPGTEPEVIVCLDDADATVRTLACAALARIGAPSALRALFARLADVNPGVTQAATAAIQALGDGTTRSLALEAAGHPSLAVRHAALRILAYFGFPGTLPAFLAALGSGDLRLGETALGGLALLDDAGAIEALLGASTHSIAKLRAAAMRALGHTIAVDPRIASVLAAGLRDEDPWVRYYACQALGRRRVPGASESIGPLLGDPAGQVRVAAVEALAGFADEASVAALCRAAAGAEVDMRRAALIGLGLLRRVDVLPVLLEGARTADAATRLVALSALAELGGPGVLPALTSAAADPDDNVRVAALGLVAGQPGRAAADALILRLATARPDDRERILVHLATPTAAHTAAILGALATSDEALVPGLIAALVRTRTPDALAALRAAAGLPSPVLRRAAASGLAAVGSAEALQIVAHLAEHDPDPSVRVACAALRP